MLSGVTLRFDGAIVGVGTESGVRLVVGLWSRSPFGPIVDVMIETADGHRILIAPREEVAQFIAATYNFDEIRIEATSLIADGSRARVASDSLRLSFEVGRRTKVGWLLAAVPARVGRSSRWCQMIDPIAHVIRPGVRTVGTAGGGRREFYCALDEHAVSSVSAHFDGGDLGALHVIDPPVRFGFASTPRRPSLVQVSTIIDQPEAAL
jgi:hypothetical protein